MKTLIKLMIAVCLVCNLHAEPPPGWEPQAPYEPAPTVPEPSTLQLGAVVGVVLLAYRFRSRVVRFWRWRSVIVAGSLLALASSGHAETWNYPPDMVLISKGDAKLLGQMHDCALYLSVIMICQLVAMFKGYIADVLKPARASKISGTVAVEPASGRESTVS